MLAGQRKVAERCEKLESHIGKHIGNRAFALFHWQRRVIVRSFAQPGQACCNDYRNDLSPQGFQRGDRPRVYPAVDRKAY